jgi:hypothetical protein
MTVRVWKRGWVRLGDENVWWIRRFVVGLKSVRLKLEGRSAKNKQTNKVLMIIK